MDLELEALAEKITAEQSEDIVVVVADHDVDNDNKSNNNDAEEEDGGSDESPEGDDLFPILPMTQEDGEQNNESDNGSPILLLPPPPPLPHPVEEDAVPEEEESSSSSTKFDEAKSKIGNLFEAKAKQNKVSSSPLLLLPAIEDSTTTTTTATATTTKSLTIKRKRPTGLGNLGNTCFMNSTLQCLAHTPPLRSYFLSNDYERDLNKDNPLGTGGELAKEFAALLKEMWTFEKTVTTTAATTAAAAANVVVNKSNEEDEKKDGEDDPAATAISSSSDDNNNILLPSSTNSSGIYSSSRIYSPGNNGGNWKSSTYHNNNNNNSSLNSNSFTTPPSVTYPRSFKTTLGKHASQFIGYDQHDSQELAIYLLDALHEDTNRVHKKPYIEYPEQLDGESDEEAASKAWQLYLQREDSRILEICMGQNKSKLQCPIEGCGRVSTTFDPCMYLSVPIPGSMDRVMKVVFVPMVVLDEENNGEEESSQAAATTAAFTAAEMTMKLPKNSTIGMLRSKIVTMAREAYHPHLASSPDTLLQEEDVVLADVFQQKIWTYYNDLDHAIDGIKDSDVTYAFQVESGKRIEMEVERYQKEKKEEEEKAAVEREREMKRRQMEDKEGCSSDADNNNNNSSKNRSNKSNKTNSSLLDEATKQHLDKENEWQNTLSKFCAQPHSLYHYLNEHRSSHKERLEFYGKLLRFIQRCKQCPDATEDEEDNDDGGGGGTKAEAAVAEEEAGKKKKKKKSRVSSQQQQEEEDTGMLLEEVSQTSTTFKGVRSPRDLAMLEYCACKFLGFVNDINNGSGGGASASRKLSKKKKEVTTTASSDETATVMSEKDNAIVVQIRIKKSDTSLSYYGGNSPYGNGGYYGNNNNKSPSSSSTSAASKFSWKFVGDAPIVVRISPTMTVFGLRKMLARRFSCALKKMVKMDEHHCNGGGGVGGGNNNNHSPPPHLMPRPTEDNADQAGDSGGKEENEELTNHHQPPPLSSQLLSSEGVGSPEMMILRQVAFSSDKGSGNGRSNNTRYHQSNNCKEDMILGSVTMDHLTNNGGSNSNSSNGEMSKLHQPAFAKSNDEQEKELVASMIENEGTIVVNWPAHLNDDFDEDVLFAKEEFWTAEQIKEREEEGTQKKSVSVMDCIAKYCETEQLDESDMWYCNRCKEHVRAWKQFHLYRTPPILIVHLKRFHFSSTTHRRDKIDTLIDFPLEDLDLRGIVSEQQHQSGDDTDLEEKTNGKGSTGENPHEGSVVQPIYDCYAVSNHFGGLGGGHYTAYAKGDDGKWCYFDDSRVTTDVDESEVVSSAAYCLYYKRKDVVLGASSLFDENGVLRRDNDGESEDNNGGAHGMVMMPVSPSPCVEGGDDCTNNGGGDSMEVDDATNHEGDDTTNSYASYRTPEAAFNDTEEMDYGENYL